MDEDKTLEPLQEVATVAAGNAATALAKLIGQEVTVAVPSVHLLPVEKVMAEVGGKARVSAAALVRITGDAQGLILCSFDPNDATGVSGTAIEKQTGGLFVDQNQEVLREIVNIIAGAALNSIAKLLGLQLSQSVPASSTDILGAVLDPFVAELGATFDKVLVQQETFTIPAQGASLRFVAIIDPPSTSTMLQKITEKVAPEHATDH